ATGQLGRTGACTGTRDPRAQKLAASATLLGAPAYDAAQPHSPTSGPAACTRVAAVKLRLWRARHGLSPSIGPRRTGCDTFARGSCLAGFARAVTEGAVITDRGWFVEG